jgi:hypothetical protein
MTSYSPTAMASAVNWQQAAMDYAVDRWQRSILYWDIMRRRGNDFFDNVREGQPPVLVFDYEVIMDARDFDPPVNYTLLKILDRRKSERDRRHEDRDAKGRRKVKAGETLEPTKKSARPLVVIDPRAGHGPGIGGSKLNSQIGIAMDYGHPVYFIMFSPDPVPGQTIAAVQEAEIRSGN